MDEEKIVRELAGDNGVPVWTQWVRETVLPILRRECLRARIDEVIFRGNHNVAYLADLRAELDAMEKGANQ